MDTAIRTVGLSKRYEEAFALDRIDLEVPAGVVFGYLGPNGAGKTTTIRLLVGLLRASAGRAEVLGLDAWAARDRVHRRLGYLPGEFVAYAGMTGEEYLRYLSDLRRDVVWAEAELLAKRLDLDLGRRIGTLSHGNRQKVGLVQAFMHRPDLLVLDEPTSGLDPLVQREFLTLVREARDGGATVFLSSHILDEVEQVADVVAILRQGRLVEVETVETLKARAVRRVALTFPGVPPAAELGRVPGVREVTCLGPTAYLVVEGSTDELFRVAAPHGISNVVAQPADLEEIFLAYYDSAPAGDPRQGEG